LFISVNKILCVLRVVAEFPDDVGDIEPSLHDHLVNG
jgi:hypothetical protein